VVRSVRHLRAVTIFTVLIHMKSACDSALTSLVLRATLLSVCFVNISLPGLSQEDTANTSPKPELARVVIRMDKRTFKPDESIPVYVDLEALGKGVYIAKEWGQAGENIPGFWFVLKTEEGRPAQSCGTGAVADYARPLPPPSQVFRAEFFLLAAGKSIGIGHDLPCVRPISGRYRVEAGYSPNYPQTSEVANLPEARGLVLDHELNAVPITIEIR
jgi:hypothetical protein